MNICNNLLTFTYKMKNTLTPAEFNNLVTQGNDDLLDLYFDSFRQRQEERIIECIETCIKIKFPDIQGLIVSMNSVKYLDDRYSIEEVTEFVMSLYKPKDVDFKPIKMP